VKVVISTRGEFCPNQWIAKRCVERGMTVSRRLRLPQTVEELACQLYGLTPEEAAANAAALDAGQDLEPVERDFDEPDFLYGEIEDQYAANRHNEPDFRVNPVLVAVVEDIPPQIREAWGYAVVDVPHESIKEFSINEEYEADGNTVRREYILSRDRKQTWE
jgi:hypothetical protein